MLVWLLSEFPLIINSKFPLTPALSPRRGRIFGSDLYLSAPFQFRRYEAPVGREMLHPLLGERAGVRGNFDFSEGAQFPTPTECSQELRSSLGRIGRNAVLFILRQKH